MATSSVNNIPIRLPDERWIHITEEHCELAGFRREVLETIAHPARIYEGNQGELLALKPLSDNKWLVVVYKEIDDTDGFVITAFLTKRLQAFQNRRLCYERKTG